MSPLWLLRNTGINAPLFHVCTVNMTWVFFFLFFNFAQNKKYDKHRVHTCYVECWKQHSHYLCYWSHQSRRSQPGISLGFFWWRCAPSSSGWTSPHYGRQWSHWRWGGFHHSASIYTYRQIYIYIQYYKAHYFGSECCCGVNLMVCTCTHSIACISDSYTLAFSSILWKQFVRQETATLHTVSSV